MEGEEQLAEVEKVLLYISEAKERGTRARAELERTGAAPHLVAALRDAERRLDDDHRELMQGTFFAVSSDQDRLVV